MEYTMNDQNTEQIDFEIFKLYASLETISQNADLDEDEIEKIKENFQNFIEKFMTPRNVNNQRQQYISQRIQSKRFLQDRTIEPKELDQIESMGLMRFEIKGDSLLLRAMSIMKRNDLQKSKLNEIVKLLIDIFPDLINLKNICYQGNGVAGVAPIHLAVVREDLEILEAMAEKVGPFRKDIQSITDDKDIYQGTVLMAGTLLGIATLKCNEKLFITILVKFDQEMDTTNKKGDNIIHSLIKYATKVQPDKLESVLNMFTYIINFRFIQDISGKRDKHKSECKYRKQVGKLLKMKNKEKLTPLQLAAKRQQYQMFEIIMEHEVYLSQESKNGILHDNKYDITEIETIALQADVKGTENEDIKPELHESVLEYIVYHHTKNAFLFSNITPVKEVIKEKWQHYRPWFLAWFAIYFVFMVLLSSAAVLRSEMDNTSQRNGTAKYLHHVTRNGFVTSLSEVGLLFAVLFLLIEVRRLYIKRFSLKMYSFRKRLQHHFSSPYSNFMFRIYFGFFSFSLVADFVCAALLATGILPGYENVCLIFAVIIGWYLVLFFLQIFKSWSFYTVLIQRVITDMLKMACVMVIFLIAFSIAMYMIMQGADIEQDDFDNLGKTMVKMITIMLGIGELDVLFHSRQPILAVLVFLLFVLLTTILLLNALIAMMSKSCMDEQ